MKEKNQAVPDEVLKGVYQPVQDRSRCKQIPQAIACPGIGENA